MLLCTSAGGFFVHKGLVHKKNTQWKAFHQVLLKLTYSPSKYLYRPSYWPLEVVQE